MITVKRFAEDKFFKVHRHPNPLNHTWRDYRAIADRLNLTDSRADGLPLELPEVDQHYTQPEIKTAYTASHTPDIGKTEIVDSISALPDTASVIQPAIPFDADGYKALLIPVYKLGFNLLSSKTATDYTIDQDEAEELAGATIPVLRKYVRGGFAYAEEAALITTLVGIYTRKKIKGAIMEQIPVETKLDDQAVDISKKTFSGVSDILSKNIDFKTITPIPIDDLTYKKMRDLTTKLGIVNLTRSEAERFAAVTSQLNVDIDFLSGIAAQVDPEAVKTLYSQLIEGK